MTERKIKEILGRRLYEVYTGYQNGQSFEAMAKKLGFLVPTVRIYYNMAVQCLREYQGYRNMRIARRIDLSLSLGELACIVDVLEDALQQKSKQRNAAGEAYLERRKQRTEQIIKWARERLEAENVPLIEDEPVPVEWE